MHPIVLSELHQSKRGLPWQLLLLLSASAVLQGILGLPAVLVLLSPAVAAAIGVGTLAEEYSKGQLRFLYSMPISPARLWCIKVLSGIVGTSLVVAVVLLPSLFIYRPLIKIPGLDELGFLPGPLMTVFAGQAVLAYAAGLFTIGFCQVAGTAVLLASLMSFLTLLTYALMTAARGLMPGPTDLGLGLAVASLPLWLGAYVLFRRRNPFVDQPWRWRGVAAVFAGFYALAVIGVGYGLTFRPVGLTDPYRDGVFYFSVFANDSKVFVLGRRSFWDVQAYVLEKDGRLARDLFQTDQALSMPAPRQDAMDSPMILCWQADVSFMGTGAPKTWFLLNLETGAQTPVSRLEGSDNSTYYDYRRSSRDGRSAMGLKAVRQGGRLSYCAFRQDLITFDFREIPIYEGRGEVTCSYLDDSRVLLADLWSGEPPEGKLTLIDLESGVRTPRQLPDDVRQPCLAPDRRTCTALRQTVHGDTIQQELAVLDVTTGRWTTIIPSQELSRLGVQDVLANRYRLPSFHYPDSHSPDWLVCVVENVSAKPADWLINVRTGARFKLPRSKEDRFNSPRRFAKDGSRFFTSEEHSEPGQDGGHRLLRVYRLENSRVELINAFAWTGALGEPAWLGDDRLVYCRRIKSGLLSDRGELWSLDVENGQQRPFFAGVPSVAEHQ